ncbi:putative ATP-dependent RNA helicase TDRD12 [Chrysoperla carnea]|uniref:putative ATP-dependent RNA helicase TDRD12 n=1 Tax=Chrysoperla carnea TaxID=189513 RepID=UPI001D084F15|nr:putative ATP-dependent RNA helicase TDRD12 [Chrysoperla carnea]
MTSESEFELVEVTHFINPHLFWINRIEDADTEYKIFYDKLQTFAEQSGTCIPHLKKVYAFKDPVKNIWARGVIELDIDLKVAQSLVNNKIRDTSYKVWLIDEGRPIDVSHLPHRLPPEFREKETKCERCILFGVIPAITDLNMSLEVFEKRRICEWQISAKNIVKELLSRKNAQVFFKTRKYLENVVIGDLQIVLKNKLYNIAEHLVEKGFAFMDEKNFLKVQRHIILEPSCRVKTPSDTQSRPPSVQSRSISNQSRPPSVQSQPVSSQSKNKKIPSNLSSRSISVQSETIPKRFTDNKIIDDLNDISDLVDSDPPLRAFTKRPTVDSSKSQKMNTIPSSRSISVQSETIPKHPTIKNAIADDLDDVSDLVDSDPPLRAFTKRTITESHMRHRKPITSDSSSSENEISKLQHTVTTHTKPSPQIKTSPNDGLILNRTAGRGSRRSLKLKQQNNSFKDESLEISDSQNESFEFESELNSVGRGTRKHLKSPENLNESNSLSVRKKLFNAKDKLISNTSGKTPAKQLFTDVISINTIDHTLAMNQDAEFYDNTDSEITSDEKNSLIEKNGKISEVKTCIAVIKNIDEEQSPKKQIVEEDLLSVGKTEDDALFLERFNQKQAKKLENERKLLELMEKNKEPHEEETKENISPKQTTVKPSVTKLLKKLKIKKSSSTDTTNPKSSSTPIPSSNLDSSSASRCESTTSSNDFTDNETLYKKKQTSTEVNSTFNWPKVDNAPVSNQKLNIMPAGALVELPNMKREPKNQYTRQMPRKTNNQNMEESDDGIITVESFLERQVKTFQTGRNLKAATSSLSPVLNVGGFNTSRFLIHSLKKITPIQNVGQAYLHSDIRNVLTSLNIIELHNLQTYVWPAINRGENVVAIWPKYTHNKPDENSCMMFLPLMCNTIIENNYDDLGNFDGPIVLILCAHKTAARIIYEKTLLLLNLIIKREKFEHTQKNKNKSNARIPTKNRAYLLLDNIDIIRGDIVISTPKCFMNRLNQMRGFATEFRRLCHLVIDDADIITDRYSSELTEILSQCQNTLDRRRNAIRNIQLILTGEKWTNGVEELCKKSKIKPAICIETQIEAAIYAKVNMNLQFIRKETKMEILYELINQKISTFKTLLMCNKYSEIEEVVNFLNSKGIEALSFQKRVTGTEIKHTFDQWNTALPGAYKLLVLTDDVLADISITSAMWLIHYTLPRTWTHFSNRFNTLNANYPSFYATTNRAVASPKVHIFIDESHIEVVPRMINFLERLSNNANFTKLLPLKEAAILAKEEKKLQTKNTELCYLLLSTGVCPNEYRCNKRHLLFSNIDSPTFSNIKIGSSIKLKLIEQYDAVHYSARLIDSDSEYKMLSLDLASYYRENPGKLSTIDINKVYAYKKTETLYERCKIIEKTSRISSTSIEYYKILLIDTGEVKTVTFKSLFDLPECFTKDQSEQLSLDVFIANVKPSHDEIIWDIENNTKLKNKLSDINIYDPDMFITCDVQLAIGNRIWIDNVQIIEQFPHTKTCLERLNLTYELERETL